MKKTYVFIISLICFMFSFASKVDAVNYQGNYGYSYSTSSTTFWFISDNNELDEVYLNIEDMSPIRISDTDYMYSEGVHFFTSGGDLKDKEYYYTVCRESQCIDVIDPLAKGINATRDRNIILSNDDISVEKWPSVTTLNTSDYNRSIYAIDAEKFAEKLVIKQSEEEGAETIVDSIFARISNPSKYSEESSSNVSIGYEYLEKFGMKYIEIGNLYDSYNYFYPNQEYSSKTSNTVAIKELKSAIVQFKNIKMNVIARVNFLEISPELETILKSFSSDYVANGRINTNNSIMQRYLKDVYMHWVNEYKVDGFYILDAQHYNQEYLKSLINEIKTESKNDKLLIYTDSKETTVNYISNDIQDALLGSLYDYQSTAILAGNFGEQNFDKLINAMFSGYYNNYENYKYTNNVINNLGDLEGLDLYSKTILFSGLGTADSIIYDKIKLAFLTVFSSAGIPRVVAGNEFFNTNAIPTNEVDSTDSKICMLNTKWCYAIGDSKHLDWGYLIKNSSVLFSATSYRTRYAHQYPSQYSMSTNKGISYDNELSKSGILYINFIYEPSKVGDYEKSIMVVNYSNNDVEIDAITNKDYDIYNGLVGKVKKSGDKSIIEKLTFFTLTETKVNKTPKWVFIVVMIALLVIVFGLRAVCVKMLKTRQGIDYNEYMRQQRLMNKKGHKKEKVREPSVFELYLKNDPIFNKSKKIKKEEKDTNNLNTKESKEDKEKEDPNQ